MLWFVAFLLSGAGSLPARSDEVSGAFAQMVRSNHVAAQQRFLVATNDAQAAWHYGRACFDLAELASNDVSKAEIAQAGIAACRLAITNDPACAPAYYYLGMTLGQFADTKRNLAALRMVKEMERVFKKAAELDEKLDHAGPDRNLGLLYWQAPSIGSIGSRSKARQHLRRALDIASDFPENQLNFIEVELKWGDHNHARRELQQLDQSWTEAHQRLSGLEWATSWRDWESRRNAARKKLGDAKPLSSPHSD